MREGRGQELPLPRPVPHSGFSHGDGGVPLKTVAEILGHTTTAMTERYAHLLPEHQLKAVEMLPDWGWRNQRREV